MVLAHLSANCHLDDLSPSPLDELSLGLDRCPPPREGNGHRRHTAANIDRLEP